MKRLKDQLESEVRTVEIKTAIFKPNDLPPYFSFPSHTIPSRSAGLKPAKDAN